MDDADKASMAIEKEWDTTLQVMTDVMPVIEEQLVLKRGCWVRLKRGIFKDDIAQVDYVDAGQSSVHLKLVPRIDYSRLRDTLRDKTEVKRKQCHRPPQKLFDMEAVRAIGGEISQDGGFIIFEGNRYSLKGLLYKSFVMSAIQTEDVKPTLSELEKFEEQPEDMDVELARSAKAEQEHLFTPGDNVEVIEGELINLQGTIVKIDGTKVTIMPKHEDLKDPLEFPAHDLKLLPQDLQLRTAVALGAEQNTTQKDVVKVDVKRPCSDAVRADLAAGDGSERGRGVWMDLERDSIDQTIQITQEPYKGGPGFAAYLSPPAGTPSPASGNQPSTSPGTACTASSPTGGFSPHTAGLSPQTPAGGADRAGLDWLTTDIELISAVQKANGSPNQMKFWLSVQRDIAGKPRNQRQRRSLIKKADAFRRKFAKNKQFSSWRARTPWCLCRHVPARNRR